MNQGKEKRKINKNFVSIFVLFLLCFFVGKGTAYASTTLDFSPESGLYMIGDTVRVKIVISSDTSVNAVSAKIKFPTNLLNLTSISKTGIVSLWAQEPTFSNSDGTAEIEGVILKGYTGSGGVAATLVFKAKSIGTANLSFESGSIYANDGSGTDIASGKGGSSLTIIKNENIKTIAPVVTEKSMNLTILEVKDNSENYSQNKFSITSVRPVKDNLYYIQIDALTPVVWIDDGSHIYQVENIAQGEHTIKAMAVDTSLNVLNGSLNFSTEVLKVPTLTYYLKDIFPEEFMVLKGTADPSVDVEITLTNEDTGDVFISHVETNSDGNFTFVPENKLTVGKYLVKARADLNGVFSSYMPSVEIVNQEHLFNIFITRVNNYLTILTPLFALLVLLILVIVYGIYRIKKFRIHLKNKLLQTEKSLTKDFQTLEEDAEKENLILQKARENKPLETGENTFMDKFKQDIETTVGNLDKDVKDLDK